MLRYVAVHEGLNVRQLAQSLGRDYKNVHTDVIGLVELGLMDRSENGTLFTPYDEIIIHAGIRDAAGETRFGLASVQREVAKLNRIRVMSASEAVDLREKAKNFLTEVGIGSGYV